MMARLVSILRSSWLRRAFVVGALAAAVWAVASQWDQVQAALTSIPPSTVVLSFVVGVAYVFVTMLSWRAVLKDMGSKVSIRQAGRLFFVSQLGKYLPGGVWNFLAVAEMGADLHIPRRRSISVLMVSILVSIVMAMILASAALLLGPQELTDQYGWVGWTLPLFMVVLLPPVLNRLLAAALRVVRRPALEKPLSIGGVGAAAAWALLAWMLAGIQLWLLISALGADATVESFALAVGGYALAWTVGFLVIVVPAGVGVREAVLALVLSGHLGTGAVVVTVLLSRVLLTAADLVLGVVAAADARRRLEAVRDRRAAEDSQG
ncbi:lysylphosphatidylglycerol synthase transmembrane domain-containing protein [Georgenia halophila]|uniref:Lysylphosphatidylglycerol synthase transmembrane domain-containing protein n=1 Tax=Georgenia halophila TaxID=620889 RepID=A0ABP8L2H7_9MICO